MSMHLNNLNLFFEVFLPDFWIWILLGVTSACGPFDFLPFQLLMHFLLSSDFSLCQLVDHEIIYGQMLYVTGQVICSFCECCKVLMLG